MGKDEISKGLRPGDLADSCELETNVEGTCDENDARLTQPRSGFDLEDTRRSLIALRSKLGAYSPAGHRCSNLVEMIQEYERGEEISRMHLAKSISRQMAELAALTHNADQRHTQQGD
jgi:hypothetical protein